MVQNKKKIYSLRDVAIVRSNIVKTNQQSFHLQIFTIDLRSPSNGRTP